MARIQDVYGLFEKIQSADISVYQQRCVAVRNRNASCMRCADACTSGAISIQNNELVISPERCIGCGTCATVCPTCALEAHRPNDAELQKAAVAAMQANDGVAVLACRRIVDSARDLVDAKKIVAVECLGRIEESLVTSLVVAGTRKIVMVKSDCEACEHTKGLSTACAVRDTSNELLRVWQNPVRVEISDKFPGSVRATEKAPYDERRRNFFFRAKDEATRVAGIAADEAAKKTLGIEDAPEPPRYVKVMDDGTLPHFIPDRRERLLDNLAELGEPLDELIETRLWGHVVIDPDTCISCRMCATFCPTGAIQKFDDEDGTIGIDHYPGDCVRCRCCEDICPSNALTLYDEVLAEDLLSGGVEHNVMHPPKYDMSSSKRTRTMFRDILGCEDIFDR